MENLQRTQDLSDSSLFNLEAASVDDHHLVTKRKSNAIFFLFLRFELLLHYFFQVEVFPYCSFLINYANLCDFFGTLFDFTYRCYSRLCSFGECRQMLRSVYYGIITIST